jgi:hypothetical protein
MLNNNPKVSLNEDQIRHSLQYLTHTFKDSCEKYKMRTGDTKNLKNSVLYLAQVEFSYIVNEIQRGPIFFAIQQIAAANEIITDLNNVQKVVH